MSPEVGRGKVEGTPGARRSEGRTFRYLSLFATLVGYLTILLGADVTVSNDPLVCPNWPGCDPGAPVPTLGGPATAEFLHRMGALTLSLAILGLLVLAHASRQVRPGVRRMTDVAFALVIVQALLGGVIIFSDAAFSAVVLHLGLATLLFAILILIAALANFPAFPPRWQAALLGRLTPAEGLPCDPEHLAGATSKGSKENTNGPGPAPSVPSGR